jgi:lipopolysaccharide transport system ATP-binding protein
MYVRLGFAVSSLLASDIMIIDEVLAVGDNHFKKKCVKHLSSQFRDIGKTLLVVSHDMHLINSICDRCLVLDHGELIYDGTPESAIKLHLSMPSSGSNTALKTDYFIIQKVEVTSSDIQLTGKHRAGEKLEFKMSIEVLLKIPDVIFDIKVRHRSQGVISTINNLTSGTSIFLEKGQSKVICEIPTTPLNEGEYLLDLEVQHKHHLLASQKNVAKLHIEGGTFFESGRLPKPSQGLALIKSRWIHQDNA